MNANSAENQTWINDATRQLALDHVASHTVDVVVVGGGVTGAGVALDAASRGLSVALVESNDFGSGTSGYSSKLVHGGLRYLAKMDFAVAWESAVERRWLMSRIAPHLVHPLGFIIPDSRRAHPLEAATAGLGVVIYDVLRRLSGMSGAILPRPQLLSRQAVAAMVPALDADQIRRGILYWDGQVIDDARLVLGIVRTAAGLGAHVIRNLKATGMTATSVNAVDTRTAQAITIHGRTVVNATGVWAAEFEPGLTITPSRGTHLVVRAERLGNPHTAHTVAVPGLFGRYVFVLPQSTGVVYIGLTDEEDQQAEGHQPQVPEHDVGFLLGVVNTTLAVPLTRDDVVGSFAGLRPLVQSTNENNVRGTADISRRHLIQDVAGEPITVVGGKLTTYRRMAQDAVDVVTRRLGYGRTCNTRTLPLVGASGLNELDDVQAPARLIQKYGTDAVSVCALQRQYPALGEPLFEGTDITGAELLFSVLAEGATTVEDLLERRTRLALVPADAAKAQPMAEEIIALAAGIPHPYAHGEGTPE
ncbi:glycerol-3-phosphate dehydrogenase/oxidase [Arthrobacter roseus]|uniref:glycerol-3-phosphate dehydrogenase/oxidase n=1 Tax=Arthrobacter roseus TaxID=136274 RepID=UPI0019658187|nr:glycerol-3-phosphate dehydrogenase/oxidase [Arthrobacter roseus]MBM7847738.1 glycerol-3-phosphate dehydrogenase [Arthrobacter roseus]